MKILRALFAVVIAFSIPVVALADCYVYATWSPGLLVYQPANNSCVTVKHGFRCKFGAGKTISLGFGGPNSTRTACIATLQNVGSMFADKWHLSTSSGCSFHWKGSNTVEVSLR